MKVGLLLHEERGTDACIAEAQLADRQGFDSVWLGDHLMNPNAPFDALTLMSAIAPSTTEIRLAFRILNANFRYPAMLAKVLATLDQISKGRVICSLGSGSEPAEHDAYNIPVEHDHDARVQALREKVELLIALWTHPAPEKTTYSGRYVKVTDLEFMPPPYQNPHPPIWIGGESEATMQIVKDLADGWVTLTRSDQHPEYDKLDDRVQAVLGASDWPRRPMTVVREARIFVDKDHDAAEADARSTLGGVFGRFGEIYGTPDECIEQIAEIERRGMNYLRATFATLEQQTSMAELLLERITAEFPNNPS